ncbi:MAG: Lrp/AsnC ligand binding domain-containing protein [Desulfobacteraceae bacterium]|nr:Lrp/AsnC ligand binding domain-containing protein [Desulfobacteraceae bacterium]
MNVSLCSAYVLISVNAKKIKRVYSEIEKLSNVQNVDAVTGPHDIIILVQGIDFNEIGNFVLDKIGTLDGVESSMTCNVIRIMN